LLQVLEERILDEQVEAAGGFQPPLQKQKSLNPPEAEVSLFSFSFLLNDILLIK